MEALFKLASTAFKHVLHTASRSGLPGPALSGGYFYLDGDLCGRLSHHPGTEGGIRTGCRLLGVPASLVNSCGIAMVDLCDLAVCSWRLSPSRGQHGLSVPVRVLRRGR